MSDYGLESKVSGALLVNPRGGVSLVAVGPGTQESGIDQGGTSEQRKGPQRRWDPSESWGPFSILVVILLPLIPLLPSTLSPKS